MVGTHHIASATRIQLEPAFEEAASLIQIAEASGFGFGQLPLRNHDFEEFQHLQAVGGILNTQCRAHLFVVVQAAGIAFEEAHHRINQVEGCLFGGFFSAFSHGIGLVA